MVSKIKTPSVKRAKTEAQERREFDASRRDNARNILSPDQIQGKAWRATKLLQTTLGLKKGETPRAITKQDLLAFNRNIKALQAKVEKGVTADEIISLSTDADKKRSRQQITMAVPVRIKNGEVHFVTNAGPESKVLRHHVHVILADYDRGLAKGTPLQAAKEIAHGNLKFDCDCERHTFWYRYLSTLMGANAGRAETGFPKIRNPQLEGIACKHVLRVMTELNASIFIWKRIAEMIDHDRRKNADKTRPKQQKTVAMTQKEATELAKKQHRNPRVIKALKDLLATAPPPMKVKKPNQAQIQEATTLLAQAFGITREEALARLTKKPA